MTLEILLQILLGGLLGIVGQLIRFIVGYYKLADKAQQNQTTVRQSFDKSLFWSSIIIGLVAGILSLISISNFQADFLHQNIKQTILTLIAGGYAGADFIEGFVRKYIPGQQNNNNTGTNTGAAPAPGPANQPS